MSRIPQDFLDDLLQRIDIVEIIDHRVKLKRTGKNYAACCPFHDEKTPSFTVSPDKQFYYCFGCGANGTALTFLTEYERLGFIDAVENLAKLAGVEVPREAPSGAQQARDQRLKKIYNALEKAKDFYAEQLKSHPQRHTAVRYLQNRGLTGHIAKRFAMGYAPPGWDNLLRHASENREQIQTLIDAGLVIEKDHDRHYDRFRQRIIFTIRDVRGRTIGFGGRVLGDDKPKYLNSPETEAFHKGRELYGLYEVQQAERQPEHLLVVEGYMDVIALAQYGINNAVATLGTACGEEHLMLAFRYTNKIIFCFDGDNAGRTAAKRALTHSLSSMQDGRQIKFLFLPEGQDPDTLVRQIGDERFREQLKEALPLEEFLFDVVAEGIDIASMEGRARFSKLAAPLLNILPEGVYRELMFNSLAHRTGLSPEVLRELTKEPVKELAPPTATNDVAETQPDETQPHPTTNNLSAYTDEEIPAPITPPQIPADYDDQPVNSAAPWPDEDITHIEHNFVSIDSHTPQISRSNIKLSPARNAIGLLLDAPQLCQQLDEQLDIHASNDNDIATLLELIKYLKTRPQANFNKIMGHWAGTRGLASQQKLTQLLGEHRLLKDAKKLANYNALDELNACLNILSHNQQKRSREKEKLKLQQKGLSNLSKDEKQRYLQLISESSKHISRAN